MATKNATATLEGDMTGSATAYGLVKITSAGAQEGDMTSAASPYGLVNASTTQEGDMTASAAGYPLAPVSATLEGDMTGSSPTASTSQAVALATLEADMTGTATASATAAHALATLESDMTGSASAYVLVPGATQMSGSSAFTPTPGITAAMNVTFGNVGANPAIPQLIAQPSVHFAGSTSLAISSKVPGTVNLGGVSTVFATPHISRAAPPVVFGGASAFAAHPIGPTSNSTYGTLVAYATIGNPDYFRQQIVIEAGTLSIKRILAQRTTATFVVTDSAAQYTFLPGMLVIIRDTYGNRLFSGMVSQDDITKPTNAGPTIQHTLQCVDVTSRLDERTVEATYTNQTCGAMVTDILQNQVGGEGLYIATGKNLLTDALSTPLSGTIPAGMSTVSASVMRATALNLWNGQDCWQWQPNGATTYEELLVLLADGSFSDNTTYTCSFYARCLAGTPTIRYEGYESNPSTGFGTATATLSATWQRFSVTWTTPNPVPNRGSNSLGLRIDTGSATYSIPIQVAGFQIEANGSATAWEFGGSATITAGPVVATHVVPYKSAADEIEQLAEYANFQWYADEWHRIYFQSIGAVAAPFTLVSHLHVIADSGTLTNASPLYRNRQYIKGITSLTSTQTESRVGDGQTRAFTMSYPVHAAPSSVKVNGTTKTIGTKGNTTGKDFYWTKGDPVIAQDTSGTLLTSSDTLQVTYIGEYPSVILSVDDNAAALRAYLTGMGTGIVEEVETLPSLTSDSEGFQMGSALLQRFTAQGQKFVFSTYHTGLTKGMNLTVTAPELNIVNQAMLVEEVDITDGDPAIIYTVTAIIGPFDTNWVSFFKKLARPPNYADANGGGENGTLSLAQAFTASYATLSATWTATVTSVPFPSSSLYPSSSEYPG